MKKGIITALVFAGLSTAGFAQTTPATKKADTTKTMVVKKHKQMQIHTTDLHKGNRKLESAGNETATKMHSNGSMMHSNGKMMGTNKTMMHSKGSKMHSNGTMMHSNGKMMDTNRTKMHTNGTMMHSNRSRMHSNGTMMDSAHAYKKNSKMYK